MISNSFLSSLLPLLALTPFLLSLAEPTTTPSITRFNQKISWDTNITLLGAATVKNRAIRLTSADNADAVIAGRALYSVPIRFLEPTTRSPASFSSRFTFSIVPSPSQTFGDGLAFVITSDPEFLGSGSGYLGLFSEDTHQECSSGDDIVTIAVEFDTSLDSSFRDINDNHVGVDVCSIFSIASADAGNAGVGLKEGIAMTAWIDYSSAEKKMRVSVSYSRFRPPNPLLVANVDLSSIFRESMYVGFSASNHQVGSGATHMVHRWSFRTFGFTSYSPSPPSVGPPSGNDYNIPSVVIPPKGMRNLWLGLGLGGGLLILFLIMAAAVIRWYLACKKREDGDENTGIDDSNVARISLHEIKSATREFHRSRVIGQGNSGTMYEGVLPSGCKVAVKRFSRVDHFTNTFAAEVAAVLGCSHHPNLVPLKGWCCERHELLLMYEYMPNGSLDKALHVAPSATSKLLSWDKRYNIVLGVASALAFLHEECEKKIVHRDVKTCNILLDEEFNARLGDFGLARLNEHTRPSMVTQPAGTMGYLAPEYVHSGVPTEKSDVYSFGIVVLEVATGRRPVERGIVLVDLVWGLLGHRRLVEAADKRLNGRFSREEMSRVLNVGLCCAHPDCKQRPSMRKAIRMLKGTMAVPVLPPKKPAVRLFSHLPEVSEESNDTSVRPSSGDSAPWLTPCISLN